MNKTLERIKKREQVLSLKENAGLTYAKRRKQFKVIATQAQEIFENVECKTQVKKNRKNPLEDFVIERWHMVFVAKLIYPDLSLPELCEFFETSTTQIRQDIKLIVNYLKGDK